MVVDRHRFARSVILIASKAVLYAFSISPLPTFHPMRMLVARPAEKPKPVENDVTEFRYVFAVTTVLPNPPMMAEENMVDTLYEMVPIPDGKPYLMISLT